MIEIGDHFNQSSMITDDWRKTNSNTTSPNNIEQTDCRAFMQVKNSTTF